MTTIKRAVCLFFSRILVQPLKVKEKKENKQSWQNEVDCNSDSKSAVRTHGCLLHGLWLPHCRLENESSGEILVIWRKKKMQTRKKKKKSPGT